MFHTFQTISDAINSYNVMIALYGYKNFIIPVYYKTGTYKALIKKIADNKNKIMDANVEYYSDQFIVDLNRLRFKKGLKRIIL